MRLRGILGSTFCLKRLLEIRSKALLVNGVNRQNWCDGFGLLQELSLLRIEILASHAVNPHFFR